MRGMEDQRSAAIAHLRAARANDGAWCLSLQARMATGTHRRVLGVDLAAAADREPDRPMRNEIDRIFAYGSWTGVLLFILSIVAGIVT
jgi:hypothetical protein